MATIKDYFHGEMGRNIFLSGIVVGFGGIAGMVLGIPLIGYILTPLFKPTPEGWRGRGCGSDFPPGKPERCATNSPTGRTRLGQDRRPLVGAWLQHKPTAD